MRTSTFEKKSETHFFFFFFFGYFCRKSCHADVDSREQQAILLKKVKKSGQNCVFPIVFPAKNLVQLCHAVLDFREHQGLPLD
jgi:hypothetical protein|tara:strand:+ start:151 stop:399 length:249 start_codon:yes stop_codon:yes gene_type:complete